LNSCRESKCKIVVFNDCCEQSQKLSIYYENALK
jgi:hypothetical protein